MLTAGCGGSESSGSSNSDSASGGGTASTGTATTGGTTATADAGSGGKQLIAFVTNNASDYWTIARIGTEAAQKELPDINLQFIMPADGTAATQMQQVDGLIAKGVKGIAISPVDPKNQTAWLTTIAAKTKLITQDSDAPNSHRIAYIGTDNHAAGLQVGGLIKQAIPQGGPIMLFVGTRDAQNAHDRETGIRDALKGSNIQILDVKTDDADHARAKSNAADVLVKNQNIAGLVGLWSYNGPAILSALQDAGKVGKVKIVCFDEEDQTLAGIKSGAIYATVVQQPYQFGYQGVKLLAQLIKGDMSGVPKGGQRNIPTQAITKANLADYQAKLNKLRGR
ncbi:MAG: sugar-binding protein [Armatimonadota bacterium]|nr:sugar-binding protein [Armatimonadota bacterium]